MANLNFDQLASEYQQATDHLIDTIRQQQSLVTPDHSILAMKAWDNGCSSVEDAAKSAKKTRDAYQDALREKIYDF